MSEYFGDLMKELWVSSVDWSGEDWSSWIDEKVDERRQVFLISPDELAGSFNREKSAARDYHGRELLELIQNADDSGVGYSGKCRLLIRLTDDGLLVANTGLTFSPEGVVSLIVSDNSPKQFLRTKCIGYKGLGFRSVLGWASSVVILSGKLSVGFSEGFAADLLRRLRSESSGIDLKVKQFEERIGVKNPVATLAVPRFLRSGDEFGNDRVKTLFDEGTKLLKDGFDTVVCLAFRSPEKTREQVQQQIDSLGREILLFLQFLEKIDIKSPGRSESWLVDRRKDKIVVNLGMDDARTWRVFGDSGVIPQEFLRPEQELSNKYEIKLAIPDDGVEVYRLFVFFPTEVRFPFPLVAHATFEVGDNRQHIIDSDANRFIAGKLAGLMAKSAEQIKDGSVPWFALESVAPQGDIDSVLEKFGFLGMLDESIKQYALLPVRGERFEVARKAKRIKGNFDDFLTGELFRDVCVFSDNSSISRQLNGLGVDFIDYDDLRVRLNKISESLSLGLRVELIFLLVKNDLVENEPPEILIDEDGLIISSKSAIFLPPEKKVFSLPPWVSQKILSSDLTAELRSRFGVSRVTELALNLSDFRVQPYNLNSIVSAVVAETNRRVKEQPDSELGLRRQMVQAIWSLYSSSSDKVKLRDETNIILPARNGIFVSARSLYLGKEYSGGKVLESLYAHLDAGLFVIDVGQMGFSDVSAGVEAFLCWMGVGSSPRLVELSFSKGDYFNYVINALGYPAKFGSDITISSSKEFRSCSKKLTKVLCLDRFEDVLQTADPHAIIYWIATSPVVDEWRLSKDTNAVFEVKKSRQWDFRKLIEQTIPSYPLWLLKNTEWLPISSGSKLSPSKCSLARGAKDLEPIIGYPAINIEHPLVKDLKLDSTYVKNALIKIGVVTDLNDLPWDAFYEVLLKLPELDPEGGKAKSLYRILMGGRSDVEIAPCGGKYEEFMSKGKMLGKVKGKVSYYPIDKLFYVENITLPLKIAEQFSLLEVDRRRGAAKVKKLFNVDQLSRDKIQIEIMNFEELLASQSFESEVERLKSYIYALRVDEDSNRANLGALKRLSIKLCKSVRVSVLIGGEHKEIDLSEGDTINIDTVAYLVVKPSDNPRLLADERVADAFGEIVATIMRVDKNNEIARLASCSSANRDFILDKMCGGSGSERLGRAKEMLKIPAEKEDALEVFVKPSPWTHPVKPEEKPASEDINEGVVPKTDVVGDVSSTDLGVPPVLPARQVVAHRVQSNPSATKASNSKKRVNPDRAENLALRFEESQGRFPLKVSHIRGFEAFGCDLLSFKSASDSITFKDSSNPDLVERYIEVKGSSSEKGSFALAGNELFSARKYQEKYFVYRVYEEEEAGLFELIELGDPLDSERDVIELRYEVNPFRSDKSHVWQVKEND